MPSLFADTSGWGNIVDPKQPFHKLASSIYQAARKANRRTVTTNYVIAELEPLLTSRAKIARRDVIRFIEKLKVSPYVQIVHVDPALDDEAWQLLKSRQDKEWSLVDCSSFVLMNRLGITEALTTDHHFEQAGFRRLLQ